MPLGLDMKRTFSLAQLGSAGLLSKVPVFHRVCSTYSHTQTARSNIRMEVKDCSVYLVDIASLRAVVVIHPGTHWFAKAKLVVPKAKLQTSGLRKLWPKNKWTGSPALNTVHVVS